MRQSSCRSERTFMRDQKVQEERQNHKRKGQFPHSWRFLVPVSMSTSTLLFLKFLLLLLSCFFQSYLLLTHGILNEFLFHMNNMNNRNKLKNILLKDSLFNQIIHYRGPLKKIYIPVIFKFILQFYLTGPGTIS